LSSFRLESVCRELSRKSAFRHRGDVFGRMPVRRTKVRISRTLIRARTFDSGGQFVEKCRAAPLLSAIPVEDCEMAAYSVAAED
jgi:Ni,Fe-hydrogenase III large subunit